ncbi:hypothetical protein SPSIL_018360 [Sporomusa silvacetica DSM 10669]|uniref:Uncharacterized protein n=1 Tax=Sporomusa silvacetica DSM 10669 TaxID=1123289 RepID=A0ABZ3IJ37_9FIRM|nr:hypothetical protein SPSIL_25190 [Sporomusa silvacetica DSM 10669]
MYFTNINTWYLDRIIWLLAGCLTLSGTALA